MAYVYNICNDRRYPGEVFFTDRDPNKIKWLHKGFYIRIWDTVARRNVADLHSLDELGDWLTAGERKIWYKEYAHMFQAKPANNEAIMPKKYASGGVVYGRSQSGNVVSAQIGREVSCFTASRNVGKSRVGEHLEDWAKATGQTIIHIKPDITITHRPN